MYPVFVCLTNCFSYFQNNLYTFVKSYNLIRAHACFTAMLLFVFSKIYQIYLKRLRKFLERSNCLMVWVNDFHIPPANKALA